MKNSSVHPWGWTDERRAKQAQAIRQWQPWRASTGPVTPEGKARSSQNASKPNSIRRELIELHAEVMAVYRMVTRIEAKRRKRAGYARHMFSRFARQTADRAQVPCNSLLDLVMLTYPQITGGTHNAHLLGLQFMELVDWPVPTEQFRHARDVSRSRRRFIGPFRPEQA